MPLSLFPCNTVKMPFRFQNLYCGLLLKILLYLVPEEFAENFYKSGYAQFGIYLNPNYSEIMTTTLKVYASGKIFTFHSAGGFQMCNIYSQPTGHAGDIAYNSAQHRFQCYIGGATNAWGYELMSAGW